MFISYKIFDPIVICIANNYQSPPEDIKNGKQTMKINSSVTNINKSKTRS